MPRLRLGWTRSTRRRERSGRRRTLPRWRDLPIVERIAHDANPDERQRWADDVAVISATYGFTDDYAPGNGGAIRTWRQQNGTRSHHVSLGANGYYDLSAGIRHHKPVETQIEALVSKTPTRP